MGLKELQGVDAVKDVKSFIEKNSRCPTCHRSLNAYWFNRIPLKTKEEFNKWVKEEFCDDRGMGLKQCWDDHLELKKLKEFLYSLKLVISNKQEDGKEM